MICVPSMLFPKPLYLEKQRKLHLQHEHDKHNIPMQEQLNNENQGLLDAN